MDISSFPSEVRELAAIEKRLVTGELTLDQLREIEEEVFTKATAKTREISERLFSRIGEKRRSLVDRQIEQMSQKGDLESKIQRLSLLNFYLTPEEIDKEIAAIKQDAELLDEKERAVHERALEALVFAAAYPVVWELKDDAPESNFASRIERITERMREQNSLIPFLKELNPAQQKEAGRSL